MFAVISPNNRFKNVYTRGAQKVLTFGMKQIWYRAVTLYKLTLVLKNYKFKI